MSTALTIAKVPLWMTLPALTLVALPLIALITATSPAHLSAAIEHPMVWPALWLSLSTSSLSVIIVLALGTPLAWWLSRNSGRRAGLVTLLVDLPIVLPPAVIGVALLLAFGRQGSVGGWLAQIGVELPFTRAAVVMAQVIVSAPFFIKAATVAFSKVDEDLLLVARSLGRGPRECFFRVALPIALPGVLTGVGLAWARALGEFGATLLFAGNLRGETQTMPLAIYSALESDLDVAQALALLLAAMATLVLGALGLIARFGGAQARGERR